MAELLAVCSNPDCVKFFSATFLSIGGNAAIVNLRLDDIWESCIFCGGRAKVISGTYKAKGNDIQFVSGPPESVQTLRRIKQLIERAAQTTATKEEVIQQVEVDSPELATLLRAFTAKIGAVDLKYWFVAVITLFAIYLNHADSVSSSAQLERQAIEQQDILRTNAAQAARDAEETRAALRALGSHASPAGPYYNQAKPALNSNRAGRNKPCGCGSGKRQRNCCKEY